MVEATDQAERMERACNVIATCAPELSAQTLLSRAQRRVIVAAALIVIAGLAFSAQWTATILVACCIVAYAGAVTQRIMLTRRSLANPAVVRVTDTDARRVADGDLPMYTVL